MRETERDTESEGEKGEKWERPRVKDNIQSRNECWGTQRERKIEVRKKEKQINRKEDNGPGLSE